MVGAWESKVAVVTGAAAGIGAAIAAAGVREGALVWMLDLDERGGNLQSDRLGTNARFLRTDITNEQEVARAIEGIVHSSGRVDILVNNASRDSHADARTMTVAEWNGVMNLDLMAPWLVSRAVLPQMCERGSGSIVNIGSLHGRLTAEGAFPYGAAKAGLAGFTRSLALDVGKHGVRVNTVSPGYTASERIVAELAQMDPAEVDRIHRLHALRRIAQPAEIAEVVVFIASDAASFVTGAEWAVDGGLGARYA